MASTTKPVPPIINERFEQTVPPNKIDDSNILVVMLSSAQDIKADGVTGGNRYYISVGFPIESESGLHVGLPIGR